MNAAPREEHDGPALNCDEARRVIQYLIQDGDLKEVERRLLALHVKTCSACKGELERRRQLDQRLRKAFAGLDTSPEFTERVLEALPARGEAGSPAWLRDESRSAIDALAREAGASSRARISPRERVLCAVRIYRVPLSVAALIAIGVLGAWLRHGIVGDSTKAPALASIEAGEAKLIRDGRERELPPGYPLKDGDVVEAAAAPDGRPLCLALSSAATPIATVHLAPGAKLKAFARQRYELLAGDAYFDVHKDRPREPGENFEVRARNGRITVVGTSFGIVQPPDATRNVTVVVDEGTVEVAPAAGANVTPLRVTGGFEADLLPAGGVSPARPIAPGRMAWHRPNANAATATVQSTGPPASGGTAPSDASDVAAASAPAIEWTAIENQIDFRGRTLPAALALLAARHGDATELLRMADQTRKLGATEGHSMLRVQHPMPVERIVRWLVREQGLRLEAGGRLRVADPGELPGPPDAGDPTGAAARALDTDLPPAPEAVPLAEWLDNYLPANWLAAPGDLPPEVATVPRPAEGSARVLLDAACRDVGLAWAWYDGLVYVARPERIEALTRVPQAIDATPWVRLGGHTHAPWRAGLEFFAARVRENGLGGYALHGPARPLVAEAALQPDSLKLTYRCGRVNRVRFAEALWLLRDGTPAATLDTAPLDEHEGPRLVRSWEELAAEVREAGRALEPPKNAKVFPVSAFRNRALRLGGSIEWAARLQGLGVHTCDGRLVVEAPEVCYGAPRLQVLRCDTQAALLPADAAALPESLAETVRACYPELFAGVAFHPVKDRLLFEGDRRQLAAAQAVLFALESDLRARTAEAAPAAFDLRAWRPAWRAKLEQELARPLQAGAGSLPARSFPWLLRSSGYFSNLGCTVLVDPAAMERLAQEELPAMDVRGITAGQALRAMAEAAGLRMILEGEVVWLRDKR